jgi:sulfate adenylyltransferase subunit 2
MLYSIGKDSSVMLHLAMKAFYPSRPPFPLLHVDTTWKFREMIDFRDRMATRSGSICSCTEPRGAGTGHQPVQPRLGGPHGRLEDAGAEAGTRQIRLRRRLRRRAPRRGEVARQGAHLLVPLGAAPLGPEDAAPEALAVYNTRKNKGESIRVFPISNWTELDIWQYIHRESIPIVPLYCRRSGRSSSATAR